MIKPPPVYQANRYPQHTEIVMRRRPTKRYGEFVTYLSLAVCDVTPPVQELVLGSRQCRNLICNDGSATFAVHSTSVEAAERIMQDGYTTHGKGSSLLGLTPRPSFGSTCVILAGPKEKDQARFNTYALSYQYGEDDNNVAKLVLAFPVAHNGSQNYVGQDLGDTILGRADGQFVTQTSTEVCGEFHIPKQFVFGYFDQQNAGFVYNPLFQGFEPASTY